MVKKVLVANRGEIAIRIFRACVELGVKTVAIYTHEDRYSQHRYKADEAYQIGKDHEPLKPYLDMDQIILLAKENEVDAIHPGYGFLSENALFARKCQENGIVFIGPKHEVMTALGDKIKAKIIAVEQNIPVIESNSVPLNNIETAELEAIRIGFPIILKAAAGGGGRGMRVIRKKEDLSVAFHEAKREALNAFGDDTIFIEKYVENPKHIEVQIMADNHGNMVHLFERDCSVQRRFQKVIEIAPSFQIPQDTKNKLYQYAIKICQAVNYNNVGTVEFLVDQDQNIYFIEVNPRIQVEHTVTEMVTGIDLIKSQLYIASGQKLSDHASIAHQDSVKTYGYAIQCRITTEDPENDFKPDYGTITTYRSASGFGIRLDEGSLYQGSTVSPFFDSMLVKISAHSRSFDGAIRRMGRALREIRIRGVKTNIAFLENVIHHPTFKSGETTVNFIQNTPSLFQIDQRLDRATKMVHYLGEVVVNGHPDVSKKNIHHHFPKPIVPDYDHYGPYPEGTKNKLTQMGPEAFCQWLMKEPKIQYTDTTFRDAHQSLFATRMRTYDMLKVAEGFAKNHPQTFSMEVWGGATFDVCLRFLYENPWARLIEIRKAVPNILLQMLFRGSNAVGYTSYPDNVIDSFIEKSWDHGIDVFRIFDSLNWLKAMEPSIESVRKKTNGIAQVAMCYTGDILDGKKTKYTLDYYLKLAKDIENAGAHMLAIKDMSGLLKPYAAKELISALKQTIKIPIHLHTHDTSSLQSATYMQAIESGVHVIDVALGGLSGLTSQPNFNAIVEMMKFQPREQYFDISSLNTYSNYWEDVREYYYPFESGMKASSAEVYVHEIPGGQYSNLKPQAIALGLENRFEDIKKLYREVNDSFGDIIKVTPSSKVVGDMAQFLISNNLSMKDVYTKGEGISFPESVQSFFKGDLGQPVGGFPEPLQKIILKDKTPITGRPNEYMPPVDLEDSFNQFKKDFQKGFDRVLVYTDFLSYLMYPKVWKEAYEKHKTYGDVSKIPTKNFFYGMELMEETIIEIAKGKSIIVKLLSVGPSDALGNRTVFFKVNGQTRNIEVQDRSLKVEKVQNKKVDNTNEFHLGAPLQGLLSKIFVKKGQVVQKNQPLFVIEAMKMETTITATGNKKIEDIVLMEGTLVQAEDLVVILG